MKRNTCKLLPLLAALALLLSLLAGCAGGEPDAPPPDAPAPSEETSRSEADPPPPQTEEPAPAPRQPDQKEDPEESPAQAEEPAPEAEAQPEPEPQPEPVPEPEPEPQQEPAASVPEDGDYTAAVTLSGGSGRATVSSPAALRCEDGTFRATIVWSSPNFDYMKVDGERYDPISEPGSNSAFEIPVAAFDTPLAVVADTVAMSEPHEVEYTLTFDSATLTKR